LRLSCDLSDD